MLRLRLGRAWLVAAIPLIVVAVVTCSDDAPPPPATPDSGAQPGPLTESVCPDAAPDAGEGCTVPEGTTCSFGACAVAIAQCTRGTWRFAGNPLPEPSCPVDFPSSDQPCPACFPENGTCRYGTCDGPDATANVARATCNSGRWSIAVVEVCPADAGDAGADVQGDADADVD
jgi:hypothetical protein